MESTLPFITDVSACLYCVLLLSIFCCGVSAFLPLNESRYLLYIAVSCISAPRIWACSSFRRWSHPDIFYPAASARRAMDAKFVVVVVLGMHTILQ